MTDGNSHCSRPCVPIACEVWQLLSLVPSGGSFLSCTHWLNNSNENSEKTLCRSPELCVQLSFPVIALKTLAALALLDSHVLCCGLDTFSAFSKLKKLEAHFVYYSLFSDHWPSFSDVQYLENFCFYILFIFVVVWSGKVNVIFVVLSWLKVGVFIFHFFVYEIKCI